MATEDKRIDQLPAVGILSPEALLVIQQSGEGMKMTAQQLLDYLNSASGSVVLYVTQELTEDQRAQVRKNIRCGGVGEVSNDCVASGDYAHVEGSECIASGARSHAEGRNTKAVGNQAHAEGANGVAEGLNSHIEGQSCQAIGGASHAEGSHTVAAANFQHVQGQYNILDNVDSQGHGKFAHIVGNGWSDYRRSNAHTLDWDGNAWYAGSVEGTAMILKSPGGKRFSITVNDSGSLTAEEIV